MNFVQKGTKPSLDVEKHTETLAKLHLHGRPVPLFNASDSRLVLGLFAHSLSLSLSNFHSLILQPPKQST